MENKKVNKKCFDFEKLHKDMIDNHVLPINVAQITGYSQDTVTRYLYGNTKLDLLENTMKVMLLGAGFKYADYIIEENKEEPIKEVVETVVANNVDLQPVMAKLDELIMAINKLGNIEMQNMEYMKQLRDLMK